MKNLLKDLLLIILGVALIIAFFYIVAFVLMFIEKNPITIIPLLIIVALLTYREFK